ncbi:Cell division protein FtsX [Caprobacter fermentans]|uniref:Cell division protein FtsX n=1 Tax=Caproicibacter fermentans TaxID=2576756 RepID=A0A6N8HYQ5_9FIRM|nr:permease-like cell division protein FtsX [Caproicibacter fermentans]MVB10984.1 Cell division protein FtsX [Caproicibacter fermentans]OCN01688.1 ABC transporter permease [Clostridium sp. W14A]QNK39399.1 ABC transporter permease [Caproicibacter fermentans]
MLNNIRYLLREGVRNIWSNRTMSLASIGVLVSCLLLTGAATLFSMNISAAMASVEGSNSVKIYMDKDLPVLASLKAGEEIKKLDNIKSCQFVSKDDAIQKVMGMLGDKDSSLIKDMTGKDNPLPDAFQVSFKDLSKYKDTVEQIKKIDGVSSINDYSDIAAKLTSLDRLVTTVGFWIILLLSLVSLFIISNTIRVTMFSRRLEISIMKSVGATNWFVRVPFVVEGVIIGLISGGVGSLILRFLYDKLTGTLTSITVFSPISVGPIQWKITLMFLLAGSLFGAVGGAISIGKYLKKEGGEIVEW